MDSDRAKFKEWSEKIVIHGVIGFIPTLVSASLEEILSFIKSVKATIKLEKRGAKILGERLEGPYISTLKKGAHNLNNIRPPTEEEIKIISNIEEVSSQS